MKIVAVDIGGTSIKTCVADETGSISGFMEFDSEAEKGGPYLVSNLIQKIKETYTYFDAIGISTASHVDSEEGTIIYANQNFPDYKGMKLKAIFEKQFQVPVKVENDVNAAALGEKHFGAGQVYENFLCLAYGTGIGGAIVIDSTIYKGNNGIAGEMGHILTHPGGKKCTCGSIGCYEMYGSTTALVKSASELQPAYYNGRKIFEGLENGDASLQVVLDDWVLEVAYGLVSLTHIFNPSAIIIGGGIMEQERLVSLIASKVDELVIKSFSEVKILKAALGNKAGLLGAASLHM